MLSKHNPNDILPGSGSGPGFVAFADSVTREIEAGYVQWKVGGGPASITIDLNDRIASTGTEAKAQKNETGAVFLIKFDALVQKNVRSGFERPLQRVEIKNTAASQVCTPCSIVYSLLHALCLAPLASNAPDSCSLPPPSPPDDGQLPPFSPHLSSFRHPSRWPPPVEGPRRRSRWARCPLNSRTRLQRATAPRSSSARDSSSR